MTISLTQFDPCRHRRGKLCSHLLEQSNIHGRVTPALCNYYCPSLDGPRSEGHRPGQSSPRLVAQAAARGKYGLWEKITPDPDKPRHFVRPDFDERLWSYLHEGCQFVGGALWLGGSCIRPEGVPDPDSDIDVVIRVLMLTEDHVERLEELRDRMHTSPCGRRIDWNISEAWHRPLLPKLDVRSNKVYGSRAFIPEGSTADEGIEIHTNFHPTDNIVPFLVASAIEKRERAASLPLSAFKKRKQGLGDRVARAIKFLTRNKVKECGGCQRRRDALNRAGRKIGIGD